MNDDYRPGTDPPHDEAGRHCQPRCLTLLIDADDTLWENNIYFLEVERRFLDVVVVSGVSAALARRCLADTERRNIPLHGYGAHAFSKSLVEAFRTLLPAGADDELDTLRLQATAICDREQLELLPNVPETLHCLSSHHQLALVTKGHPDEQMRKLAWSGLGEYFHHIEVVAEKSVATYRSVVEHLNASPENTWMIGNSPRSDINPALAAGIGAVLIPHPHTWELELEDVAPGYDRFVTIPAFASLLEVFPPFEIHRGGASSRP